MTHFLAGLLGTAASLFGVRLRYSPFAHAFTPGQKRQLFIAHAILAALMIAIMTMFLHLWHHMETIRLVRIGGIIFSTVSALTQLAILKKWFREQLFVFFIVLACSYVLLSIPSFVGTFFSQDIGCGYFFIVVGTYFGVMLVAHLPMYIVLRDTVAPFLDIDTGNYWNTLWCIPLTIFGIRLLSSVNLEYTNDVPHLLENLLSFVVILLLCRSISRDHAHMQENHLMDQHMTQQQVHYAELKVRLEEARKLKHDIKHHIAAIRHYMDMDDKAGLDAYCNDLVSHLETKDKPPYSGNLAADGIIYHYMQRATACNVDFRFTGTIRSPGIKDMDLCVLLGNALDNALAGCMTIEEGRSISLIVQSEAHLFSIAIQNSFDGHIAQSDTGLLSRKRDHSSHGIGLSSMRAICERYGGSLNTQWDDSTFTVVFILPLSEV